MEKQKLPNGTAVIVLGILSIITCCCYGVIGLILGIVAIVLANKDAKLYYENPELYSNFSNIKTGKILAYIGIALSAIYIIYMIWLVSALGMDALSNPELMQERMKDLMGQ